jgi:hypothetical protein
MTPLTFLGLISCALSLEQGLCAVSIAENDRAEVEGQALAKTMRSQALPENSEFAGLLHIRKGKGKPTVVPLRVLTVFTPTNWQSTYSASGPNAGQSAVLTVIHTGDQPNEYWLEPASTSTGEKDKGMCLAGNAAMIPFANSDFWLFDLGLEFFHWPAQRLARKEMRRGRFCEVLESANPHPTPGTYARVISWIDQETRGLLRAEAYDTEGRLWKEFSVGSFKKIKGQWHLRDLEIRNERTGSRTRLALDLPPD